MLETQIESFKSLTKTIKRRRETVLEEICKLGGATCQEVSESLGWPINCVSGRISELQRRNLIETLSSKPNASTGKFNAIWTAKEIKNDR